MMVTYMHSETSLSRSPGSFDELSRRRSRSRSITFFSCFNTSGLNRTPRGLWNFMFFCISCIFQKKKKKVKIDSPTNEKKISVHLNLIFSQSVKCKKQKVT